ncbi:MAG TPA: hypothetical protein VHB73_03750 [Alphaproteobacteria bacterium]|nr:hypothetical protein [Alphaproteobacteria bacterium]
MNRTLEEQDTLEDMANFIAALTRTVGNCTRMDLVKAGFTAKEIGDLYPLASAMAALMVKRRVKNH